MTQFMYLIIIVINLRCVKSNKYCSYELNGEPKYFICARNEYCCNFGCCVHLAFQFYQLWYYWLLLIFMFMICSGGSWWYKFCRQNETSNYPSIPRTIERSARQNLLEAQARRARALDRVSLDSSSFYLHRIWKTNGVTPPPNYYTASVVRYHGASDIESRRQQQECPYYQLYGPPPSYDSVVQMSEIGRGQPSCHLLSSSSSAAAQQTIFQQQQPEQEPNISSSSAVTIIPSTSSTLPALRSPETALKTPSTSSSSSPLASPTSQSASYLLNPNLNMPLNCQQNPLPSTSEQIVANNREHARINHHKKHQNHNLFHHHQHHYHPLIHNRNNDENRKAAIHQSQNSSIIMMDRHHSRTASSTNSINENGTRV